MLVALPPVDRSPSLHDGGLLGMAALCHGRPRHVAAQAHDDLASVQATLGDLLDPCTVMPRATKSGAASRCCSRLLAGGIPRIPNTVMLSSSKLTRSRIPKPSLRERRLEKPEALAKGKEA